MSEHTPQHQHHPAHPVDPHSVDPTLIDVVAGDPPVPDTVWRTARTDADTGRSIGARLAYRLVAAYSRPGDPVVDLTGDHALAAVCAAGERRHHPGWFTDAPSLIIGPATAPARLDTAGLCDNDLPDMGSWFGDDLTDPELPPSIDPSRPGRSLQEATSLVVACWPLDPTDVANRIRLAWPLTACARLLRPDGDAFVYHATDEELLTIAQQASPQRWAVAHLTVHADLPVFSPALRPIAAPGRGRRREGGDHHG
ncbi:hypothetical protein GA0070624_3263 [Micromonospora rhizosphaerae]|uniref:Uncharacterized protein n=1 Tax=Micromonospora rhizosphaerae TaxID=568872 RepID=A0A1C6S9T9_9ACTN|nr:hypothetical protein [Micromonospora rhizosphaerae]SCL26223.1 hypothetical protein GA0070624_3263 [Micromonospora rhizosphaerae]